MGVKFTHPDYDRMAPKWKRCRDVVSGNDAIHGAGTAYLPKLGNERDPDYKARVCRSDFFNATWRTISGLTGMAFRKPPVAELPAAIEAFRVDINLAGVNLDALAEQVVEEVLEVGRVGLLVDHPEMPVNVSAISQAAAERMGLRPTIQLYSAETIRNWKFARVNNAWSLVQVVLGESAAVPKDEFEDKVEDRYRVLDLIPNAQGAMTYRQRIFRINDKGEDEQVGEDIYPLMSGRPLDYIPFLIVGRSGKGDAIDEPPLIDLVDKNVAHYQVNSDYRHGGHFTALPTLFLAGVTQEIDANGAVKSPICIGGASAIVAADPNAKAEIIEYEGQGLGAVEKMLDRMERHMAVMGARMIADESHQAETLGATQIKRSGENSILARIVIAASEAIEEALGIMAQWAGASGTVLYQINREFTPVAMDAQQLTALVSAWQNGALSEAELFDMLKRGDVIEAEKTLDDHQEEVGQGPPVARPPANDGLAA